MVDEIASVAGIGFAEWGPADMAMSFSLPEAKDPPYPRAIQNAMNTVRKSLIGAGIALYCGWNDPGLSVEAQVDFLIDELGAGIVATPSGAFADYGRTRS